MNQSPTNTAGNDKQHRDQIIALTKARLAGKETPEDSRPLEEILDEYREWVSGKLATGYKRMDDALEAYQDSIRQEDQEQAATAIARRIVTIGRYAEPLHLFCPDETPDGPNAKFLALIEQLKDISGQMRTDPMLCQSAINLNASIRSVCSAFPSILQWLDQDDEALRKLYKEQSNARLAAKQNQSARLHLVTIQGADQLRSLHIPKQCTCCLKETDKTERIGDKDRSVDLPLCSECAAHRKAAKRFQIPVIIISGLCGILTYLLCSWLTELSVPLCIGFCVLATLTVFSLFTVFIRFRALDAQHSSRTKSVSIKYLPDNKALFTFSNATYSELFYEANRGTLIIEGDSKERTQPRREGDRTCGTIRDIAGKNNTEETSLSSVLPYPFITALITAIVALGLAFALRFSLEWAKTTYDIYTTNTCIYSDCHTYRGENAYYCDKHKCSVDGCERPIASNDQTLCTVHLQGQTEENSSKDEPSSTAQ